MHCPSLHADQEADERHEKLNPRPYHRGERREEVPSLEFYCSSAAGRRRGKEEKTFRIFRDFSRKKIFQLLLMFFILFYTQRERASEEKRKSDVGDDHWRLGC